MVGFLFDATDADDEDDERTTTSILRT